MLRGRGHRNRLLLAGWLALFVALLAIAGCTPSPNTFMPPTGASTGPSTDQGTTTTPSATQQQISKLAGTTQVDAASNQIRYTTKDVTMVAVGSPPGGEDEYWQVNGRVNPSVVVPAGATVTVEVINGDAGMSHGWVLTTTPPPYAEMPMMTGMHGGMASSYVMVAPLPEARDDQWPMTTVRFTAPTPGTYYYICQVPDHAREGMWGKLIVR